MKRLITFGVVVLTLLPTSRAPITHASDAGVDGDHIFAGVSYDSRHSLSTCDWSLPLPTYGLGARTGATTRDWNGTQWVLHQCTREDDSILVWVPEVSTETIAESSRDVVREQVPLLDQQFSPPPLRGVVKTPTWFWVHPALWIPVSVTAQVPTPRGILTMTTTATPKALEFHPGDGSDSVVECDGPGVPWTPLLSSFITTDCMYEYPVPSSVRDGGTFRARIDVVWSVTWRTNFGGSGRLPDLRLGTSHQLRVRELQAVVTR
ncbi:MAG: hypothetical protein ACO37V_03415 [Ilumatobacteraceae bacterium]